MQPSVSHNCDVVVIGAGIIGAACAWALARKGLAVIVVERGTVAGGASGAGMGHLMIAADTALHALTRRGVALWRELHEQLGGFEWTDCGVLYVAEDPQDVTLLEQLGQRFHTHGVRSEIVQGATLRALEPGLAPDLPAALWQAEDALLFPPIATARLLEASGAELWTGCTVERFRIDGRRALQGVVTTRGEIGCRRAVIATGVEAAWLARVSGCGELPIVPRRGDLAVTPARTTPVQRQIVEVGYLRLAEASPPAPGEVDPGGIAVNVQPQMRGSCLIGSTRQFGGMGRRVGRELLQQVVARAARFVPALARLPILRSWSGLRPYPLDHRPCIGALPGVEGLFVAAGHEGLGITMAPATGELIAALVSGTATEIDARPFAPGRFSDG